MATYFQQLNFSHYISYHSKSPQETSLDMCKDMFATTVSKMDDELHAYVSQ